MRQQQRWTDAQRATALALLDANGGNVTRTARDFGCSVSTLRHWRDGVGADVPDLVAETRAALTDTLRDIACKAAGIQAALLDYCADPEHLGDALDHWSDINRAMGTAIDKVALLDGEPTARIEHVVDLDVSRVD